MERRWMVHPDHEVPTQKYGAVLAVSRQAIDQAALDGATLVDKMGGVFTMMPGRHPTDLPGEMLTTGLVCEWRGSPGAVAHHEERVDIVQGERAGEVVATAVPTADVEREAPEPEHEEAPAGQPDSPVLPFEHEQLPPINDGIDESTLPDEDDTAVQAELAGR